MLVLMMRFIKYIDNQLVDSELDLPRMDSYAHMAASDGILVVSGIHCAYLYDGNRWKKIFDFS
jgi:hypothetical protein